MIERVHRGNHCPESQSSSSDRNNVLRVDTGGKNIIDQVTTLFCFIWYFHMSRPNIDPRFIKHIAFWWYMYIMYM